MITRETANAASSVEGRTFKAKRNREKGARSRFIAMVVTPAILYFGVFYYYPTLMNIYYMFCDYNLLSDPKFVGLKNVTRFFSDPLVGTAFKNTFIITLCSVPAVIILSILIASALFSIKRGAAFFRSAIFATYLTSLIVAAIVFKNWFGTELGFINNILTQLGFEKVPWLSEPNTAMFAVIVLSVWKYVGYYVVVFLAGFSNINQDLYEAARIDGAGSIKIFFRITIPQLMPTIVYAAIISSITYLRSYAAVGVLTGGGPYGSTQTVLMYMFEQGFKSRNVGYASVISVALTLVILVFTLVQMRMTNSFSEDSEV